MGAPKKATHEVVCLSLYMAVGGKLQLIPVGTLLTLTDEQAKSLCGKQKKVKEISDKKTISVGES